VSDHSYIPISLLILSAAKDLTNPVIPPLQKNPDRDSGREVPHFVGDDRHLKTAQRALNEYI
jgi:hypothetical protein